MTAVDPIGALVTFLLDDPDVAARTENRVYGGELPAEETQSEDFPRTAVVVSPAGGGLLTGRAYENFSDLRVNVVCYGATVREAWLTHLDTRAALKQMRRTLVGDVTLHWARESVSAPVARDPVTKWPTALGQFQVLAAEVAPS